MADSVTGTTTGISLGDAMNMMAHTNQASGGSTQAWDNPFMYLIWLAIFGGYGGGLFGNRTEAATDVQSTIYAANSQQSLENMIRNIGDGVASGVYDINASIKDARCDLGNALATDTAAITNSISTGVSTLNASLKDNAYALSNGLKDNAYALNNSIKDSSYGIQSQLSAGFDQAVRQTHDGFDTTNKTLMENRFVGQQGVQTLQSALEAIKYTNAQNTCAITTAIREDGDATRALINSNTMQALRDKLAEQGSALQAANFQISQLNQNAQIINALKPNAGCTCGL